MKILAIADVEQSWLTTGFDPERLRGVNNFAIFYTCARNMPETRPAKG